MLLAVLVLIMSFVVALQAKLTMTVKGLPPLHVPKKCFPYFFMQITDKSIPLKFFILPSMLSTKSDCSSTLLNLALPIS